MPKQLSLAGFDGAPALADPLFFAIFPDGDAAERISQLARRLRREHGLKGRPLATERFHVTLHYLGDFIGLPQGIVDKAIAVATATAMPSFEVAFDRAASFSGRAGNRPFVLRGSDGVAALTSFRDVLATALKKAGLASRAIPRYTPHVTLLYDGRCIAEQAIDKVSWTVREFVLVHSLVGQTLHVPLARLPMLP